MKLAQKSPLLRMPASAGTQGVPVCLLLAVVLTLVVELFNHKAFTSGRTRFWNLCRKASGRCCWQCGTWLRCLRRCFCAGGHSLVRADFYLGRGRRGERIHLLNRMTPFTVADLTVFNTGLDTLPNYLSTKYIVMLAAALVILAVGLILFWKGPRNDYPCATGWRRTAGGGAVRRTAGRQLGLPPGIPSPIPC